MMNKDNATPDAQGKPVVTTDAAAPKKISHARKLAWMARWCANNEVSLNLAGQCGFGRECVGIDAEGHYPDYEWGDTGEGIWTPQDAYHKHPCVAVLGRGKKAEAQLYEWLRWFADNGYVVERGDNPRHEWEGLGALAVMMGKHRYLRMVRKTQRTKDAAAATAGTASLATDEGPGT